MVLTSNPEHRKSTELQGFSSADLSPLGYSPGVFSFLCRAIELMLVAGETRQRVYRRNKRADLFESNYIDIIKELEKPAGMGYA